MTQPMLAAATMIVITSLSSPLSAAEPLKVVASFSILGDLAKQVGGDAVDVTTLVGPNGDAHVYEPRPTDAAAVSAADVILVNGLGLEGFLPRLIEASATRAPVIELTKGVDVMKSSEDDGDDHHRHGGDAAEKAEEGEHAHAHASEAAQAHYGEEHDGEEPHSHGGTDDHHHHHGAFDPHAWQSPRNVLIYVRNIADAFCVADREGCEGYTQRAQAYTAQLEQLDVELKTMFSAIPAEKRVIITSHEAFGYFGEAYGLTLLAPEGVSTESEASAADVGALIRQVRDNKASAIFVESISNPRLVEQIASETGLKIGGELYSDALSPADGPASTYLDMMRHNGETVSDALKGR